MKKLIAIIFFGLLSFFFFIFIGLSSFNYKNIYINFLKMNNIELSDENIKKLEIIKFPSPFLYSQVLNEKNKFYVENLKLYFSPLSLLLLKPKISKITATNVKYFINNEEYIFSIVKHDKFIEGILKNNGITNDLEIKNLKIIGQHQQNILNLNNVKINANSNFSATINEVNFTGSITNSSKDIKILKLNIQSPIYDMDLTEEFNNFTLTTGSNVIKIKDIQYFVNYIFPEVYNIIPNLTIAEGVDIKFSIKRDDKIMNFYNLLISTDSKNIEASGELKFTDNPELSNEILLHFTKLNLENSYFNNTDKKTYFTPSYANITEKKANIKIDIDKAAFKEEKLHSIVFNSTIADDHLKIDQFTGFFDNGGDFALNGELIQYNAHNMLNGKIVVNYSAFNKFLSFFNIANPGFITDNPFIFSSDYKLSSVDFFLDNIFLKSLDTQIKGYAQAQFIGSLPRINSQLTISFLDGNHDQHPLFSMPIDFVKNLFSDMDQKDYLSKYIPIRTISSLSNFDLTFNNIKLYDTKFDKINLLLSLAPSKVTVKNCIANFGHNLIDASLDVEASNIKPTFSLKINDAILPVNFLNSDSIINLRKLLVEEFDINKLNIIAKANISALYNSNFLIKNVDLDIANGKNLLVINNFSGDCFGGKLTLQGNIFLDTYNLNFVYALNNMSFNLLKDYISSAIFNSNKGAFSANGMLTTHGNSLETLIYNFYTKSHVFTKDINLENFSIDNFIETISVDHYNPGNLEQDVKKMLLTGETTFDSMEGDVEVNRGNIFLTNTEFKTKYCSGSAAGNFDIYKFNINLNSDYTFLYKYGKDDYSQQKINLPIKVDGNYFQPAKSCDTKELKPALLKKVDNTQPSAPTF